MIPPDANGAFVAAMEDVLDVYKRPRDADHPLVCLEEASKLLLKETRVPIEMKKGQPVRLDYEYERNGTASLFIMFRPPDGWRHVDVRDRHTAIDCTLALKAPSDRRFPNAKIVILVKDNLTTRRPASLYEAFPAAEARRLVERFEGGHTPKRGGRFDMA